MPTNTTTTTTTTKKYAKRQVKRIDGRLRVVFVDIQTGQIVTDLTGYDIIDNGVTGPATGTPTPTPTPTPQTGGGGGDSGGGFSQEPFNWREWQSNHSQGTGDIWKDTTTALGNLGKNLKATGDKVKDLVGIGGPSGAPKDMKAPTGANVKTADQAKISGWKDVGVTGTPQARKPGATWTEGTNNGPTAPKDGSRPYDPTFETKAYLASELRKANYSDVVIAAALGAAEQESGFDLNAVGDSGNAFGLFQWNDRKPALEAFAKEYAKEHGAQFGVNSKEAQVAFMLHELDTTEGRAKQLLLNAKTPAEATAGMVQFERFKDHNKDTAFGRNERAERLRATEKYLSEVEYLASGNPSGLPEGMDPLAAPAPLDPNNPLAPPPSQAQAFLKQIDGLTKGVNNTLLSPLTAAAGLMDSVGNAVGSLKPGELLALKDANNNWNQGRNSFFGDRVIDAARNGIKNSVDGETLRDLGEGRAILNPLRDGLNALNQAGQAFGKTVGGYIGALPFPQNPFAGQPAAAASIPGANVPLVPQNMSGPGTTGLKGNAAFTVDGQAAAVPPGKLQEAIEQNAAVEAYLETIHESMGSPAFNKTFGFEDIQDFKSHPNTKTWIDDGKDFTTAAGYGGITYANWQKYAPMAGVSDFSAESQKKVMWAMSYDNYNQTTGRNLLNDIMSGNKDAISSAFVNNSKVFGTLPGGKAASTTLSEIGKNYATKLQEKTESSYSSLAPNQARGGVASAATNVIGSAAGTGGTPFYPITSMNSAGQAMSTAQLNAIRDTTGAFATKPPSAVASGSYAASGGAYSGSGSSGGSSSLGYNPMASAVAGGAYDVVSGSSGVSYNPYAGNVSSGGGFSSKPSSGGNSAASGVKSGASGSSSSSYTPSGNPANNNSANSSYSSGSSSAKSGVSSGASSVKSSSSTSSAASSAASSARPGSSPVSGTGSSTKSGTYGQSSQSQYHW